MKFFTLLFLVLALASCRNDFTLEADFQDIPIAYAFLDAAADNNYVRVQKAFLESGGDATANAAIADSIYYAANEATVLLRNLSTDQTQVLDRVDGNQLDIRREDGVFASDPNVLYRLRDQDLRLEPGQEVELVIQRPGEEDAVATTELLRELDITRPREVVRVDEFRQPLTVRWSKGDNASLFDVQFIYHIREFDRANGNRETQRDLAQTFASALPVPERAESQVTLDVEPEAMYQFLGLNLEDNEDVVRIFDGFDVRVTAVGREALDRLTLSNANAGITSSQALPRYSNLEGGIGLVTSRTSALLEGIQFDEKSLDLLQTSDFTKNLNFQ